MIADLVVVLALVLVPGLGAALAFAPAGRLAIETRIALAFGLGYALAAGTAVLLALAHAFTKPAYIAALVVVTTAAWALALRGERRRAHLESVRRQLREEPLTSAINLAFLLLVALVWAAQSALPNLDRRSAWRYWADGLEIAGAGHVSPESEQWGMEIPTTVSKVALNAFEGGVSLFIGPDPFTGMRAILLVAAVGLVAALLALGRELGLGVFSALVPVLTVLVPKELPLSREMSYDLTRFTAENVGRMAAVCAVVAAIYALRADTVLPTFLAGGLFAVAALTHAIPMAVGAVLFAGYVLGILVADRARLRPVATRGVLLITALAIAYVAVVAVARGDLGFETAASGSYADFPADVDPTRSFSRGEYSAPVPKQGHWVTPPERLVASYARRTIDLPGRAWWSLGAVAALFLATVLLVRRRRSFLPLATAAWAWSGVMLVGALFFSYRYETQVPGHFGLWRLFDYAVLVPGLLVPALLYGAAKWRGNVREARLGAVALVALAVLAVIGVAYARQDEPTREAAAGVRVIGHVASTVPCDARMIANGRTAGTWEATTGRRAITEGRTPFLQSNVLKEVLAVLDSATQFFESPASNQSFLARQRVDYVVVVSPGVLFGSRGSGRPPAPEDADRVGALPAVRTVFRNEEVAIFAVGPDAEGERAAQPRRCPA